MTLVLGDKMVTVYDWTAEYDSRNHMVSLKQDGVELAKVYEWGTLRKVTGNAKVTLIGDIEGYLGVE